MPHPYQILVDHPPMPWGQTRVRYIGSLPEYRGQIGVTRPDRNSAAGYELLLDSGQVLRSVRRQSLEAIAQVLD
jgi:hypothetical protein